MTVIIEIGMREMQSVNTINLPLIDRNSFTYDTSCAYVDLLYRNSKRCPKHCLNVERTITTKANLMKTMEYLKNGKMICFMP